MWIDELAERRIAPRNQKKIRRHAKARPLRGDRAENGHGFVNVYARRERLVGAQQSLRRLSAAASQGVGANTGMRQAFKVGDP